MEHTVSDRQVMIGGPVSGYSGFVLYEHALAKPVARSRAATSTLR